MLRGGLPEGRHLSSYNAAARQYNNNTSTPAVDSGIDSYADGFVDTAKDYADQMKSGANDLTSTDLREWTVHQYLVVATGIVALWTVFMWMCYCGVCRCCCATRKEQRKEQPKQQKRPKRVSVNRTRTMSPSSYREALLEQDPKSTSTSPSTYTYQMVRPRVVRSGGSVYGNIGSLHSASLEANPKFDVGFDASDPNKLPLGARLHGARKLREDNLTGAGVRVAVIDSGIDYAHPGFHDKVRVKRWFRHGTPLEEDDHGTHVAGTIHFLAPDADIYDYRVFGADGNFDGDLAIAKSIRSAVDVDKCHVINMSLRCSYPVRPAIRKAVQYAYKKGVHMVCAAGNDGDGLASTDEVYTYPAMFDETISVAAVRKSEGFPSASFSESNASVVYSGIGRDVVSLRPFGGTQTMSGTSMATPHVTGLIACLLSGSSASSSSKSKSISMTDRKLRKLLRDFTVDIGPKGFDKQTGEGFVTYLAGDDDGDGYGGVGYGDGSVDSDESRSSNFNRNINIDSNNLYDLLSLVE